MDAKLKAYEELQLARKHVATAEANALAIAEVREALKRVEGKLDRVLKANKADEAK